MPVPAFATGPILKGIGAFIKANWKIVLVAVIAAAAWWKYTSLTSTIDNLTEDNARLVAEKKVLEDDNKRLETIIDKQTAAVELLGELDAKFVDRMDVLTKQLTTQRSEFNERLDALRDRPAPKTATESVDYLLEGIPYLKSSENVQ